MASKKKRVTRKRDPLRAVPDKQNVPLNPYADLWDAMAEDIDRPRAIDYGRGVRVTPKVRPSGLPRTENEGAREDGSDY